jgi:hypothetical protein
MEKKNDINNIINKFDKKASIPDAKFRYALKEQIINKYEKRSFIEKLTDLFANINLKNLSLASSALILAVIAYMSFNAFGGKTFIEFNAANNASDGSNQKIIQNILNSNPSSQINLETSIVGRDFQLNEMDSTTDFSKENGIYPDSYYYKSTVQKYILGPQSSVCPTITDSTFPASSYSNIALKLDGSKYFINNIAYNSEQKVLNNYYTDNTIQTIYLGGDYAVQFDITTQLNKKTLSDNNLDYKEIKLITEGNKSYYKLVRDSQSPFCDQTILTFESKEIKLINVLEINTNNFKVMSSKYYLNTETDANLILAIESTYTEMFDVWSNLSNTFKPVQINTISSDSKQLSINLIKPENTIDNSIIISDLLSHNTTLTNVLLDKSFYPISSSNLNIIKNTINEYALDYSVEFYARYGLNTKNDSISISAKPAILSDFVDTSDDHSNNLSIYINGNKVSSTFTGADGMEDQYELVATHNSVTYTINYKGSLAEIPRFITFNHPIANP